MDLLEELASPLRLADGLRDLADTERLGGYLPGVVAAVRRLLADDADVLDLTRGIAEANDALTRRLLALAEVELGPPPCPYAWLALGSQGRGEQVLSSDQDSALAFDPDAPGAAGPGGAEGDEAARRYFARLARLVVSALSRAGLPECYGGYMATSWSRPLGEFRDMFHGWVERPEPAALLRAEVFLDVRSVHGTLDVDVLHRVLLAGGSRGPFRVQMARAAVTFRPPLRPFGGVRTVDGTLDVKRAGTAAIVLLARLSALAAGSAAASTALRLQAAADGGTLSSRGAADLVETYRLLTGLRLRSQVEQVAAGRSPDNLLAYDDLPGAERERVRAGLRLVRDVQDAVASRYATHTVT